nr:putative HNH homing endonuclease [Oedogonium sp. 260-2_chl]QUO99085.1 putative HNH homing endonuclease [Oedogonium sp. 260-2_chl]
MSGQDEEARRTLASYAGKIGGKASSERNKKKLELFYDPEWQKLHGYKGAGKRNVESGHLAKLNDEISQVRPEQRSEAGKRGAKARIAKQQKEKTALLVAALLQHRLFKKKAILCDGESRSMAFACLLRSFLPTLLTTISCMARKKATTIRNGLEPRQTTEQSKSSTNNGNQQRSQERALYLSKRFPGTFRD